jgi:hypothetical protein
MTEWEERWISVHEAAHACVARHFGMTVEQATMTHVLVQHGPYTSPDCKKSLQCLIVGAAGDAATTCFLNFTETGPRDDQVERARLRRLGADFFERRRLMRYARDKAVALVWELKDGIFAVADALRDRRTLSQDQIDAAMSG